MSIVITGGAGFIGSCIVKALNEIAVEDIIIVDNIADSEKWKNLNGKKFSTYIHKSSFLEQLETLDGVTHVIHMGACSSTTETDFDYLWKNNVEFSKKLFAFCRDRNISFIYASSAATYGNGENGFSDLSIEGLAPLNRYGYSKHAFDTWVEKQSSMPKQCVGLKFFNVYGPNEYHKNGMFSMVYQGYKQAVEKGGIRLFKSNLSTVAHGEQKRDFLYVKDICRLVLWLMEHESVSGLFNVGTGNAASFNDLANAVFAALGKEPNIVYVDMPTGIAKQYQYYTQADVGKLRFAGYDTPFYSLQEGVDDYVKNYLAKDAYY